MAFLPLVFSCSMERGYSSYEEMFFQNSDKEFLRMIPRDGSDNSFFSLNGFRAEGLTLNDLDKVKISVYDFSLLDLLQRNDERINVALNRFKEEAQWMSIPPGYQKHGDALADPERREREFWKFIVNSLWSSAGRLENTEWNKSTEGKNTIPEKYFTQPGCLEALPGLNLKVEQLSLSSEEHKMCIRMLKRIKDHALVTIARILKEKERTQQGKAEYDRYMFDLYCEANEIRHEQENNGDFDRLPEFFRSSPRFSQFVFLEAPVAQNQVDQGRQADRENVPAQEVTQNPDQGSGGICTIQ